MKPLAAIDPACCRDIRALILDVDGVLTSGEIIYTANGDEIKAFHVRDGSGLKYWHRVGHVSAILSGRDSPVIERRAEELGVSAIVTGAKDKGTALEAILHEWKVEASACADVGDDLPDLPAMQVVGLPLAVADAVAEVKDCAAGVTESLGGRGAVREVVEAILRAQGRWDHVLSRYRTQRAEG